MNKKIVRSSNLAARFYVSDGWTIEELNQYLIKGQFIRREGSLWANEGDNLYDYFMLDVGSSYDVDKLAPNVVVKPYFSDQPAEVIAFLKSFNW